MRYGHISKYHRSPFEPRSIIRKEYNAMLEVNGIKKLVINMKGWDSQVWYKDQSTEWYPSSLSNNQTLSR